MEHGAAFLLAIPVAAMESFWGGIVDFALVALGLSLLERRMCLWTRVLVVGLRIPDGIESLKNLFS